MAVNMVPKDLNDGKADYWLTPQWAVHALFQSDWRLDGPKLPDDATIWECAAGPKDERNIVNALATYGKKESKNWKIVGTDIQDGPKYDFLQCKQALGDILVTNPPYSIKDKWLSKAYELGKPFAFLLPLVALTESIERHNLFRLMGISVIIMPERVQYVPPQHGLGTHLQGKRKSCIFPSAWFIWKLPNYKPHRMYYSLAGSGPGYRASEKYSDVSGRIVREARYRHSKKA